MPSTSPALRRGLILVVVAVGAALGPLDTAVNIAFPDITRAFQIPLASIQWVIIAYVLTYASLLLIFGRLGDIVGHRRVFVAGVVFSAAALALCGSVNVFGWFLFARGLQGVGTALVLASAPALITLTFPESSRARALGVYTMMLGAAAAVGPLLGGAMVAKWGWPAVYWYRVPLAIFVTLAVFWIVPRPTPATERPAFDFAGGTAVTVALVCALLGLNRASADGWAAWSTITLLALAFAASAGFIRIERHATAPVIDLTYFRNRAFAGANIGQVIAPGASFMVLLLAPYFLVRYTQGDITQAGMLLAISPIGGALASISGGWLLGYVSALNLRLIALTLVGAGLYSVSLWTPTVSVSVIVVTMSIQGAGLGLFQVANMHYIMGAIPRDQQGVAGALTMLTATIGITMGASLGAYGFAALGGNAQASSLDAQFTHAFQRIFEIAALIPFAGLVVMWWTSRARNRA
ncbi:MAG: MFS transporter [Gammaproteobacteria bacterium]|nr:MFS transporter [Gammaproteobacteria bacterium]